MKHDISFIKEIKNYLLGKESPLARKKLYQLYDELSNEVDLTEKEQFGIAQKTRRRIQQAISQQNRSPKSTIVYARAAMIAASLLIFGFIALFLTSPFSQNQPNQASLPIPGEDYTALFFPCGETLNMDHLQAGDSVLFAGNLIRKSSDGVISCMQLTEEAAVSVFHILQTPRSVKAEILLSDGTSILLNGGSKLYYPVQFGTGNRIVNLEGEAFFDVQKTAAESHFLVLTDGQCTEVLGTKFNIKAYANEDEVTTLLEGLVKISLVDDHSKHILLSSGQQAVVKTEHIKIKSVDTQPVLAWTDNVFHFNGMNTAEVFEEIARWYDIQIHYQESLYMVPYVGKIPRDLSLDNLINVLSYADFKVRVIVDKKNITNLIIN